MQGAKVVPSRARKAKDTFLFRITKHSKFLKEFSIDGPNPPIVWKNSLARSGRILDNCNILDKNKIVDLGKHETFVKFPIQLFFNNDIYYASSFKKKQRRRVAVHRPDRSALAPIR